MTTIYPDMRSCLTLIERDLLEGKVGIFPCDTIYGICSIVAKQQKDRILEIKERPANKNFITLMGLDAVKDSHLTVPDVLYTIWPAPLTAILVDNDGVTHAVRVPADPLLLELLSKVPSIYSTSVNVSGFQALSDFASIKRQFDGKVDFIVKSDAPPSTVPSTLIDCTVHPFRVIRQGAYDASRLESL